MIVSYQFSFFKALEQTVLIELQTIQGYEYPRYVEGLGKLLSKVKGQIYNALRGVVSGHTTVNITPAIHHDSDYIDGRWEHTCKLHVRIDVAVDNKVRSISDAIVLDKRTHYEHEYLHRQLMVVHSGYVKELVHEVHLEEILNDNEALQTQLLAGAHVGLSGTLRGCRYTPRKNYAVKLSLLHSS